MLAKEEAERVKERQTSRSSRSNRRRLAGDSGAAGQFPATVGRGPADGDCYVAHRPIRTRPGLMAHCSPRVPQKDVSKVDGARQGKCLQGLRGLFE